MVIGGSIPGVLVVAVLATSPAAVAEDLYILEKGASDISSILSLRDVNIYAILDNVLLAGATQSGAAALMQEGIVANSIGARDADSDYFVFRINDRDTNKLGKDINIVYLNRGEAIAQTTGPIPHSTLHLLRDLTRISFVPKQGIKTPPAAPPTHRLTDPEIEAIVNQVSQAQYTTYIQTLQDFGTRYSYTSGCRAAEQWAHDTLWGFGYSTELFPFTHSGNTWYDVIGRKTGLLDPDVLYLIIGHIDSISENPNVSAPGAEDNASGSACVLEAARVLSSYDFDYTIEFVLVSGEEQGLIGSEAYAQYCLDNAYSIAGVLNFDMISYEGGYGWDTNIYSDQGFPAEVALADLLAALTDDYSVAYSVRVNTNGPAYGSDHYYFSLYGYPAPFSIDAQMSSAPDWYPWYHTTDDVITNLDLDFGTEVVKGAVATLATVAGLYAPPLLVFDYPNGLPELIDPAGGTTFRVEVGPGASDAEPGTGLLYYDNTGSGFTSIPMQVVSPNVYDAVFPSLDCGTDVLFYVSAETTDATVVTDPRDAPDVTFSAISANALTFIYEDDFSSDQGWTINGLWAIGPPMGGGGEHGNPDPADDHSPSGPSSVVGYNLNGDYENGLPERYATSPVIDCADYFGVALTFYRWLGVEQPLYDHAYIRVSNDGASWATIFQNGSEISDNSWKEQTFDVSQWADGQAGFQIRYVMGPTDSGWQYCGWNVDDLTVTGYSCEPVMTGACCDAATGTCSEVLEAECLAAGGVYQGEGTVCQGDADGDGIDGACDNCDLYNPDQLDCQPNGIGDVCDIAYCVGDPWCDDCNGNSVPDDCDIAEGTSQDGNGNGVPDECEGSAKRPMPEDCATIPPGTRCSASGTCAVDNDCTEESHCVPAPVDQPELGNVCYAPKTRYLSIARNPEQVDNTARRVKLDEGTVLGWVGEPSYQSDLVGWLADIVSFEDRHYAGQWPDVVHVKGCEIAHANLCDGGTHCTPNGCPGTENCVHHSYHVEAIALGQDIGDENNYSEVLELRTNSTWGDTVTSGPRGLLQPPDGVPGLADIMATIAHFQGDDIAPLTWLDIAPSTWEFSPDQIVGLGDIMGAICGFCGCEYTGLGPLGCSP